ncbi:hypothetical protein KKA69_05710 [Patescibacteria group bacterium]|nr:hypothetical protein [Patescibacteria group bacterium]
MAVLIEAISVVIRLETIVEKYPGGLDQYVNDCPNRTLCMDEEIVRVGFMAPADMNAFTGNLERIGFKYIEDEEFDEIAVVDQFDGIFLPCDWLEYLKLVIFEGDIRVAICKRKGNSVGDVAFPLGWNYETSLSKRTLILDSESIEHRFIFLRRKGGVDFYLDALTGEEMFIDRSARRNTNA